MAWAYLRRQSTWPFIRWSLCGTRTRLWGAYRPGLAMGTPKLEMKMGLFDTEGRGRHISGHHIAERSGEREMSDAGRRGVVTINKKYRGRQRKSKMGNTSQVR